MQKFKNSLTSDNFVAVGKIALIAMSTLAVNVVATVAVEKIHDSLTD